MLRSVGEDCGVLPLKARVLVLCTGNSCRSIMAEALINHLLGDRYEAVSAGSSPTGSIHPRALETLARYDVPASAPRSKSWDEFAGQAFDRVLTVCDQAALEPCPVFSGKAFRMHWSIPDPAKVPGLEDEITRAFEEAFELLRGRIEREFP